MKNQRSVEIKVGITVIIAMIILLWIIGWAKNISLFEDEKLLTVKFNNVAGLEVGDQVFVDGVRKGHVVRIENTSKGVYVTFNLPLDIKLNRDATFSIMMLDLMGGKKIEISPGDSDEPIDFSQIYSGKFKGDISTAMAALSNVQDDLIDAVRELKITLTSVNSLLSNEQFSTDLKNGIKNINKLTSNLNAVIEENKFPLNKLLVSSNSLVTRIDSTLGETTPKMDSVFVSLRNTLSSSNELMNSINKLIEETKSSENNVGKLLYDKNLLKNLTESIERLNKLTKVLLDQLQKDGINVDANVNLF